MLNRFFISCFLILLLLAGQAGKSMVWAQESVPDGQPAAAVPTDGEGNAEYPDGITLEQDSLTIGPAALSGNMGRYAFSRFQTTATYRYFTLGYTRRIFQWDNVGFLPFGNGRDDPFTGINTVSLKLKKKGPIAGRWRYYARGQISSSFEKKPGSPSLDVLAAMGYDFSSRFKVRVGAALLFHDVRTIVVPLAALKFWGGGKSADKPLFTISVGLPETTISYHHSPRWEFCGSLLADSTVADLANDSPVIANGFVETRDIVMSLLVRFSPTPSLTLAAGLGYDTLRRIKFYTPEGQKITDYEVKGALSGRLLLTVLF
ncbi:MAG: hypothetical protein V3S89_03705 [Desulfobacterales bacterium]